MDAYYWLILILVFDPFSFAIIDLNVVVNLTHDQCL